MKPEKNPDQNTIELEQVVVQLINEDIIRVTVKEHAHIDIEDVIRIQEAKRKLIGDKPHSVLFLTPKQGFMTREARNFSTSEQVNINARAKAIVLNGIAMRIISYFFINYHKPAVIHRTFESEKEAMKWLESFK